MEPETLITQIYIKWQLAEKYGTEQEANVLKSMYIDLVLEEQNQTA